MKMGPYVGATVAALVLVGHVSAQNGTSSGDGQGQWTCSHSEDANIVFHDALCTCATDQCDTEGIGWVSDRKHTQYRL